ncbi:Rootletin [Operophtera brumata]|uniref:Rootletin n=1 Tax=Operophtera brumata TaxID=104452 RepID=A0A0L7LSY8_OPEBR|nr:Rootletin [Operophtera brumata]
MDSPLGSAGSDLRRQNEELRARLAGEAADHRRRLDAYRRAQQGQAALVSRLQSKVLQYKQRCSELEHQMLETTPRSDYRPKSSIALPSPAALPSSSSESRMDERISDLDTALRRLEEEKRKCEKLVSQNNLLRDQLEESHHLNEALTNDLQKLTNDWEALRDEMAIKDDEWKNEEEAFNDYYSSEHNRLLSLWRDVVSVKRYFAELQSTTERDLYRVKNDLDSSVREMVGVLSGYSINAFAQSVSKNMRVELRDMTSQRDTALSELRERDARIQRLLSELQGLEERCDGAETACQEASVMRGALEEVARALIHDSETSTIPHPHHEKESMQKTVETLRMDKNNLERNRVEINAMVESLTSDYEKLQKINSRLEKIIETLENDKRNLNGEVDQLHRESANRESVLRSEEERSSRLRAELVTTREELNKTALARDMLEQQKMESEAILSQMEKIRSDLEIELERTLLERGDLQDLVEKLQSNLRNLESDKKKLQEDIQCLEEEKCNLCSQSSEQAGDLNSLRKELLSAEQTRMELEADKASLCEKIKFLEAEREKKDTLNEEIIRLTQRLEQATETIGRLNRTLEDHILIDSLDKDKQHLQEQLAGVRSEKDALEAVLFDTANMLEDSENKRNKSNSPPHQGPRQQREENARDSQLHEQLRQALEHKLSQTIAQLTSEKESSDAGAREREKKLLAARDQLILQHDEAISSRATGRCFDCEQNKLERCRREAQARADQDRNYVNQLKDEMAALKTRLEELNSPTASPSATRLEENRTSLELELSRVQSTLKECETGGEHVTRELKQTENQLKRERAALEQASHDIKELQSRLQNESEERERAAGEAAAARRHGAELEALLGAARGDLTACRQHYLP